MSNATGRRCLRVVAIVITTLAMTSVLAGTASAQSSTVAPAATVAERDGAALGHTGGVSVMAAALGLLVVIGIGGAFLARAARRTNPSAVSSDPAGAGMSTHDESGGR